MKKTYKFIITTLLSILLISFSIDAQNAKSIVTKESGGSIQTPLTSTIILNKSSTLMREWIAVHDPNLPASLVGTPGIKTIYESGRVTGEYKYTTSFTLDIKEHLAAFEVRFLLFDLWGNHVKTLSMTEVGNVLIKSDFSGQWRAYSENEVSAYYASVAYLARVRTLDGIVIEANPLPVIEEAKKFSKKFTVESLEPESTKKP